MSTSMSCGRRGRGEGKVEPARGDVEGELMDNVDQVEGVRRLGCGEVGEEDGGRAGGDEEDTCSGGICGGNPTIEGRPDVER